MPSRLMRAESHPSASNAHHRHRPQGDAGHPPRAFRALTCLLGIVLVTVTGLSGCTTVVIGSAAAVSAAALYDRRHYQVFAEDQEIELRATYALQLDPSMRSRSRIAATSYNRKVLLTGQADSAAIAEAASASISRLPKVEAVLDEIRVGPRLSLQRETEDVYLTSRVKLAMAKIRLTDFNPARVKVVTEDAVVYLLGLVTPEEAEAAGEAARYVPGVRSVVKLFERNPPRN